MRSVALDLGVKKIAFCEVAEGRVVSRRTVQGLSMLSDVLGKHTPPARVAVEACREAWHVREQLMSWGHEVLLVDTTRVGKLGIGQHGRKTDRVDAEVLARAVESGHIPVAHVLSPERRELRMQLSVRRALIETRSQYVTTIRGLLRAHGQRLASCDPDVFVPRFREAKFDDNVNALCAPLLALLSVLETQLSDTERTLQELAEREPMTQFLMTAPGVGLIVAAMFVSVVDDAKRFKTAHQLESYLGLVPSEDSSGGKRRLGGISKQGNPYMRALLVQSAWCILRLRHSSDPIHVWATSLAERRGKRIAVVAVARRLAGVLWAMWRDGTVYAAEVLGEASARGTARQAQALHVRTKALERATAKSKIFGRRQRASDAAAARSAEKHV
jgi:transposase